MNISWYGKEIKVYLIINFISLRGSNTNCSRNFFWGLKFRHFQMKMNQIETYWGTFFWFVIGHIPRRGGGGAMNQKRGDDQNTNILRNCCWHEIRVFLYLYVWPFLDSNIFEYLFHEFFSIWIYLDICLFKS